MSSIVNYNGCSLILYSTEASIPIGPSINMNCDYLASQSVMDWKASSCLGLNDKGLPGFY